MTDGSGEGLISILLLKVACCGGLVLASTGGLSGFGTWIIGGGYAWIGLAIFAVLAGVALYIRRRSRFDAGTDANAARRHGIRPVS